MARSYVLTWADSQSDNSTDVVIYGPFDNKDKAVKWGHKWQEANGDDPSWNTIRLLYPVVSGALTVSVIEPITYIEEK